ncbi:MAG: YlbF family regulator [Clostridium sp.]|jgi:cell fate (sporulation/competence/biofilm development) regulator YlbF (YheA/YmcA/DUF963 family)|nr:YlbF family regulator [Clostridium sp.]
MSSVGEAVKQLIAAIQDSKEYADYHRDIERVKQLPELKMRLDAFRKQNFELQTREDMDLEMLEQIEQEYQSLMEDPLVNRYLSSELALCRMVQDINLALAESIDFE